MPNVPDGTGWSELYNPEDPAEVRRRQMIELDAQPPQEVSEPMLDLDELDENMNFD